MRFGALEGVLNGKEFEGHFALGTEVPALPMPSASVLFHNLSCNEKPIARRLTAPAGVRAGASDDAELP